MKNLLEEALKERIVIFDGAMGTEIYRKNFFVNESYENLCLRAPNVIREIHRSYLEAGAEVLTTNSYGANFNKLSKFGLGDKLREINETAVRLAREISAGQALIGASVGPVGEIPQGICWTHEKSVAVIREHAAALLGAEPDFLNFETLLSLDQLSCVLEALKDLPETPFMVSMALDRNACTVKGESAWAAVELIRKSGLHPAAFGLNCGSGPGDMLHALEELHDKIPFPLIAQPNSGAPKSVDDRKIAMCSPEYFTTYAVRFAALGVRGIGGCCGTTPAHIADMKRSVSPMAKQAGKIELSVKTVEIPLKDPVPTEKKSSLAAKIKARQWVHTVEIVPPQGYLLAQTVEKSRLAAEAGFDAVNIPDGPRASSRVSPMVTADKIRQGAGIETILHVCCRDRNLIGMQADLLGCAALGLHNILFITGDPPKLGDYPFASGVFDVDSIGIVKVQNRLNRGVDVGGKAIDAPTQAFIAVGADPNAIDMQREVRRTREKIEAGAELVITQPVFDVDALFRFMDRVPELADGKTPLIAGIWPLASYRNAEFMRNEVPGVVVPDAVMQEMAQADTKEAQREAGIRIARAALEKVRSRAAGVQISAPFGRVETAIAVMKRS